MVCLYCGVETGELKDHGTAQQCAEALEREVARIVRGHARNVFSRARTEKEADRSPNYRPTSILSPEAA
jgi:hypothetical protein